MRLESGINFSIFGGTKRESGVSAFISYPLKFNSKKERFASCPRRKRFRFPAGTQNTYSTDDLNQYTSLVPSAEGVVEALTYDDADGKATLVQTSTGTWQIEHNAENRPIRFENAGTQTVVECGYDS